MGRYTEGPSRRAAAWLVPLLVALGPPGLLAAGGQAAGVGEGPSPASAAPPAAVVAPSGRVPADGARTPLRWVEREAYAMGTLLRVRVGAADRERALRASEEAIRAVEGLEDLLSTWTPETELARANRAPVGEPVRLSGELAGILAVAFARAEETGGAFHPAVGALVDAWDLRGDGRRPGSDGLERAVAASGDGAVRFDADARELVRLDSMAWLDAGGFGKGAALGRARRALREAGVSGALLDFGGQLLAVGRGPAEAGAWRAAVADPGNRDRTVASLALRDVSAATTGTSERFVVVDGETVGHVIDPRTGRPVPSWGSVTVVAADPAAADALSTGLFVMGADAALEWARDRTDVGVLVAERTAGGPTLRWNRAMEAWLIDDETSRTWEIHRR